MLNALDAHLSPDQLPRALLLQVLYTIRREQLLIESDIAGAFFEAVVAQAEAARLVRGLKRQG